MSETTTSIQEPLNSNRTRLYFEVIAKTASGEPLSGQELKVTLTGDGSFAPNFDSKEVSRVTDADGSAHVTWYRRNIWTRAPKATLAIAAESDGSLVIEERDEPPPEQVGPRTGWTAPRPFKPRPM